MRVLIAAIHGIMTGQTTTSWPDHLDAWMWRRYPEVKVFKKEYLAGPFPRWNCLVKNVWLARSLANEMELLLGGTPGGTTVQREDSLAATAAFPPPWFVAHSNGAVIALSTAKRLIARGYQVGGMVLTGAACEADIAKNGVGEWLRNGQLGAAIAYASEDDAVLAGDPRAEETVWQKARARIWHWLMRPYGCLGRTGWLADGEPVSNRAGSSSAGFQPAVSPTFSRQRVERSHAARVLEGTRVENPRYSRLKVCATTERASRLLTRWFRGGHSVYFAPEHRGETFEQILSDILEHQTT